MLLFALLLFALVFGLSRAVDYHMRFSIPSFDAVLWHADELEGDDFSAFSSRGFADYEIAVFDGEGNQLYSSGAHAAEHLGYDFVARMGSNEAIEDDGFIGSSGGILHKYEYANEQGERRLLACVVPVASEATLARTALGVKRIWFLTIPAILLLAAGCGLWIACIIRKGVRPLGQAIELYRKSGTMPDAGAVPAELQDSLDAFSKLACQIADDRQETQRLIANASHDLKTPLTVIKGFAQAIDQGMVSPEKQEEYIRAIARRSASAAGMIDSFLSFSKMDHPDFTVHCMPRDVGAVALDVVEEKRLEVEEVGYSLECEIDRRSGRGGLVACVDEVLVVRLLENLVGNACKHNPRGTRVRVWCGREGELVVLRVADDGFGIPEEMRERAFDPFATDASGRSSGGGVGLGLAIALRCAEACGGSIRLENEPDAPFCTEFIVAFPACFAKGREERIQVQ